MSKMPCKFYAGQNDRGSVYFLCDSTSGLFIWGPTGWVLSENGTIKDTLHAIGASKAEKMEPADLPLFLFDSPYGH